MAYLMHIGFDNNKRLWRNVFYLEYKGIRFKLIQSSSRKWRHTLLTIVSDANHSELKRARQQAYDAASEFLAALSWQNNAIIMLGEAGGRGVGSSFLLRKAQVSIRSFPRIPYTGTHTNYDITKIPHIENQKQQEALVLFREACACNNNYLALLFFWQVILVGNRDPDKWIDDAYRNKRTKLRLSSGDLHRLKELVPRAESIGKYFRESCRNAIAHIPDRHTGKVKVKLDTVEDNQRITTSMWILKEFARLYVIDALGVQKCMYLVRKHAKASPVYMTEESVRNTPCNIAYRRPSRP